MYTLTFDDKTDLINTYEFFINFGYSRNQYMFAQKNGYNTIIFYKKNMIVSKNKILVFDAVTYDIHNIEFY